MLEVGGHTAGELRIRKELIALRRARCLRDPATTTSWKSPVTGKSAANSGSNYGNGNYEREIEENRSGYKNEGSYENVPNASLRGDIRDGERGLLHNWRNQSWMDAGEYQETALDRHGVATRRPGDISEASDRGEPNNVGNQGEERRVFKQGRRDRAFKKTSRTSRKDCLSKYSSCRNDQLQNSTLALSQLSLEEEEHSDELESCNGEDVGFSKLNRRPTNLDYNSRSGSPLLTRDLMNSGEQNGNNKKGYCSRNFSKDASRQKEGSYTPTSTCSYSRNGDRIASIVGSWDGTAFSGDDEMDGLDLPRQGCGIPCYWSRTPKHRGSGGSFSPSLSDSVRRKVGCMVARNQTASQKESPLATVNNKRSSYMLGSAIEGLPLLIDGGEGRASSGDGVSDGRLTDFGELDLEAATKLDRRRRSRQRSQDQQELALTSGSRELALYEDRHRSLSQKYRPRSFDELVGQNIVVQTLVNAILRGKIAPVYLFQGPRGTGKTSTARIFAAALNCLSPENLRPCGFCRECIDFASGRSVDVREVDAASSNGIERVKTLLKNVALAPSFSRFKVFIIDDCHMLAFETWTALLKSLEEPPGHVVFIFITTDSDKLPRTAVSRCQKYLFPKIKDNEVVSRLQKLAIEENLDIDLDALDLIAAKSDGSLRDAETMLDQLSLQGQRITLSLVHELVGVVSDEKLLDLLELALSADTARTVRSAREVMDAGIEPMTLMSQLASLIMDILAGSYKLADIKGKGTFFRRHALTEEELERLRRALKILADAEKQLRVSNDQTTWLTAALLQFGSGRSHLVPTSSGNSVTQSPVALKERNLKGLLYFDSSARQVLDKEKQFEAPLEQLDSKMMSKSRMGKKNHSLKKSNFMYYHEANKGVPVSNIEAQTHILDYSPVLSGRGRDLPIDIDDNSESGQTEFSCMSPGKLDDIWRRTIEECRSNTVGQFLHAQGKLVSVSMGEGFAIVQLEFWHRDHKLRAERSLKSILNSFQLVLGCNVEVRISLASLASEAEDIISRKDSVDLLKFSAGKQRKRTSMTTAEVRYESDSTTVNSDQRRTHGETFRETHYTVNGPESFTAMPQGTHKESPMPAQRFQAETVSSVNIVESSDSNIVHGMEQEISRAGKDPVTDEQRLESAWLQAAERGASGLTDVIKPERNQVVPRDGISFQNGIVSSVGIGMVPLGVALQQKDGMLNHEVKPLKTNGDIVIWKHERARTDDPDNQLSSSLNQGTFVSGFEEENFTHGSGSKCGCILCWQAPRFDQEKAKQQRRQRRRKSGLLLWVVPCAKAKR
eukprot:Gb_02960 [translate_table: standard]